LESATNTYKGYFTPTFTGGCKSIHSDSVYALNAQDGFRLGLQFRTSICSSTQHPALMEVACTHHSVLAPERPQPRVGVPVPVNGAVELTQGVAPGLLVIGASTQAT
jgi:hypothetical protein